MQDAPPDRPPMEVAAGRYRLDACLGRGGMAEVWRARDLELGVDRALKVLQGRGRALEVRARRLRTEARAMARANSPRVLRIYDIAEHEGVPFVVMELAPGGTLEDRLREHGPLPPRQVTAWMLHVLEALEAAHTIGVVHRDVKPSNILLDARGDAVLGDFGIALLDDDGRHTRTGVTMGSMAYMAPEQRIDARNVGPAADLYAAGATMYHLLTASTPIDLFIADAASPRWADVPPSLVPLLVAATRLEPARRPASAAAFADALRAVVSELPEATSPPALTRPLDRARGLPATATADARTLGVDTLRGETATGLPATPLSLLVVLSLTALMTAAVSQHLRGLRRVADPPPAAVSAPAEARPAEVVEVLSPPAEGAGGTTGAGEISVKESVPAEAPTTPIVPQKRARKTPPAGSVETPAPALRAAAAAGSLVGYWVGHFGGFDLECELSGPDDRITGTMTAVVGGVRTRYAVSGRSDAGGVVLVDDQPGLRQGQYRLRFDPDEDALDGEFVTSGYGPGGNQTSPVRLIRKR